MALNDFELEKLIIRCIYFIYNFLHIRSGRVVSMITENNRDRTESTINDDCIHDCLLYVCTCDSDQVRLKRSTRIFARYIYIYAHRVLCSADVSRRKARRQMEVDRTTAVSKNLALNGGEKKVFARPFSLSPDSTPPPPPPPHHPTTFLHSACYTLPLPWCTGTSKASPPATSRLVPLTD